MCVEGARLSPDTEYAKLQAIGVANERREAEQTDERSTLMKYVSGNVTILGIRMQCETGKEEKEDLVTILQESTYIEKEETINGLISTTGSRAEQGLEQRHVTLRVQAPKQRS